MLSKKLAAIAAISMITASSAAVAQSTQPQGAATGATVTRSAASMEGQSNLDRRGYGIYIVGAVILGLIGWGIYELVHNNNNNNPTSP